MTPKQDQEKVELYRAYSIEEILDRRELFSISSSGSGKESADG